MRNTRILSDLILICFCAIIQAYAQTTVILAARAIDVTTSKVLSPPSIVVEGNG